RLMELSATTPLVEPKEALARSEALLAEARRLGHCPDVAFALLERGSALSEAAADKTALAGALAGVRAAARTADSCRADRTRADALFELVETLERTDASAADRHDALDATAATVRRIDSQDHRIALLQLESRAFSHDGQAKLAIGFGETA